MVFQLISNLEIVSLKLKKQIMSFAKTIIPSIEEVMIYIICCPCICYANMK